MATREEALRKYTFKDEALELDKRVYYSLTDNEDLQSHKTSKLISIMFKKLVEKGIIEDEEIDDILLEACH